ncbi:single-strand DNA-binding protein [Thermosporothrix hazakensis]|jgi:single-strand DNA-binding protein|uniref:Single-stranded DNA-binding protein n=1 Tax=Thermosporothrix hazakensis TaxID=644383 RepID=A0A326U0H5_THEHA|nr:single-stranded DNA-binding protein [Thermosporothrix hazakensis]PZW23896.1 single-strand DNA-binding protein [Thermosporothrix hazakensis]GCE48504.1 single-stranded DNA-binding protein [Thermosporothrix hazakensis]
MLWNQCQFAGRLGRDPEMSYTPNGKAVLRFSIAVDQGKDQPAMWLNVTVWEALAERLSQTLYKGAPVFVQGRLVQRSYTDKNGINRVSTDVIATTAQLLEKPKTNTTSANYEAEPHPFSSSLKEPSDYPF